MATTGDIVLLSLRGTYLGEDWFNIFTYRVENSPTAGYLSGLAEEFVSWVVSAYQSFANDNVVFATVKTTNIFNDDEYERPIEPPMVGSRSSSSGGALPNLISAGIRLVRGNKRVRHGYKYVIGGLETDINNNYWNTSSFGLLSTLGDRMTMNLNPGLGVDTFAPVIVGRVKEGSSYRLPRNQTELGINWSYIVGYIVSDTVTTTRSRKPR